MNSDTLPVPYCDVATMVDAVTAALDTIKECYADLRKAQCTLTTLPGWDLSRVGVLYSSSQQYNHQCDSDGNECKKVCRAIIAAAWKAIGDKLRLRDMMTNQQYHEWYRNIETADLPDISIQNVWATIEGLVARFPEFAGRVVEEAYQTCRPRGDRFKTNDRYAVGRKLILTWMTQSRYAGGYDIRHDQKHRLRDIATTMNLLDGNGIPKSFWGEIVDAVDSTNAQTRGKVRNAETQYFRLKWFENGNLHIEFKRADLLLKWNGMVGARELHAGEDSIHGRSETNARFRQQAEREERDAQPDQQDDTALHEALFHQSGILKVLPEVA